MYYISGFYKFKKIHRIKKTKKLLNDIFSKYNVRGTIIISSEGVNGTISSNKKNLELVLNKINSINAHIGKGSLKRFLTFDFISFELKIRTRLML